MVMYAYGNISWAVTRKRNNDQNDNGGGGLVLNQLSIKRIWKKVYLYWPWNSFLHYAIPHNDTE